MTKSRLGKGLSALITETGGESKLSEIFVENIEPNPFQPRQEFDDQALKELGKSIEKNGLIQPITVRRVEPDRYQLVSGERRWRAARLVGVNKLPALVRDYSEQQMMEIALIENLQREDLNPIEEAQAYYRMINEFDLTQEQVAEKVGKSRSSIANFVRLLNLPPRVQVYVSRETLTVGHARALLSLKDKQQQIQAADHILSQELSVREAESYINNLKSSGTEEKKQRTVDRGLPEKWIKTTEKLSHRLGKKVQIKNRKNKKVLNIEVSEYGELLELLELLTD